MDGNRKQRVTVIDSVMGSGKSNWAINTIRNASSPIMYVTPYLEEVDRFKKEVSKLVEPYGSEVNGSNKSENLIKLLDKGISIATTHSLFSLMDDKALKVIKDKGYILILDEVVEAYQTYPMTKQDYLLLKEKEYIFVDPVDNKVYANQDDDTRYVKKEVFTTGVFYDFFQCVENKMVYEHNNTPIVEYPIEIFKSFDSIFVLTYMFNGSTLKALFNIHSIDYEFKTLPTFTEDYFSDIMKEKGYLFDNVQYKGAKFKHLIKIEDREKMLMYEDTERRTNTVLSSTWYKKHGKYRGGDIGKKCRSFFRSTCKAKSSESLYTTFKEFYGDVNVGGYVSSFVVMNVRATNKYSDRKYGAYLVNRFLNPIVKSFILSKGADINEDLFALSEMLQWVWRLRIRNEESIHLYIPSVRMKNLMDTWLGVGFGELDMLGRGNLG